MGTTLVRFSTQKEAINIIIGIIDALEKLGEYGVYEYGVYYVKFYEVYKLDSGIDTNYITPLGEVNFWVNHLNRKDLIIRSLTSMFNMCCYRKQTGTVSHGDGDTITVTVIW
jgi:hypothetical protein